MRSASRITFGCLASLTCVAGCSGLLGLDDFAAGTGGGASTGSTTTTTTSDASSGSTVTATSTATSSSGSTSEGGGGNGTTSDGGGGSTSSDGGGGSTSSDGGGGSTSSDGGGGSTSSDGGGGSTSSDGGGGGVVDPGPTVVITSASVAEGQTTNTSRATFLFGSSPAGSAVSFECDLDDSGAFSDCTSGFDRSLLRGGAHALRIRGKNAAGVDGPILTRNWIIEALGTTIPLLRTGAVPEQTLVTVSTNVRATVMLTHQGVQNIFVQDQNGSTIATARNHAIRTFARNAEPAMAAGLGLTITGTYQVVDGSSVINAAEYIRGAQMAAYAELNSNETDVIDAENLESAVMWLAVEIPTNFDCSSCDNPTQGNCLHGCGACNPIPYRDFVNPQPPLYEYGSYRGVMVGDTQREFWYVESLEQGDDICL